MLSIYEAPRYLWSRTNNWDNSRKSRSTAYKLNMISYQSLNLKVCVRNSYRDPVLVVQTKQSHQVWSNDGIYLGKGG